MFQCFTNNKDKDKRKRSNGPPKRKSLNALTADERAVDWWRHRLEDGEDEIPVSGRSRSFDDSMNRMQKRNPLEKTYELKTREKPLKPEDGNILRLEMVNGAKSPVRNKKGVATFQPQVLTKKNGPPGKPEQEPLEKITLIGLSETKSPSVVRNKKGVGKFQPQVSPKRTLPPGKTQKERLEKATITGRSETKSPSVVRNKKGVAKFQPQVSPKKSVPPGKAPKEPLEKVTLPRLAETERQPNAKKATPKKKKVLSNHFREQDSKKRAPKTSGVHPYDLYANREEDDDHLSDVPSDVDSMTKERYLLACQMLKTRLFQKEKALLPTERDFILNLLGDYENNIDAGSHVSEDQVSVIERATLRLEIDPLFQSSSDEGTDSPPVPPSPLTAASMQKKNVASNVDQDEGRELIHIPKNPHTSTRKPRRSFLSLPCNPNSAGEAGADDRAVLVIPKGVRVKEEDRSGEAGESVRFNEYPFRILGADGKNVEPRVLTPSIMEVLRGFFPDSLRKSNLWLKFSMARDGASLATLLSTVRASAYTIIGVETMHGEVFGSFTGSPWRTGTRWYGSGNDAFLWRLKKARMTTPKNSNPSSSGNEMEVYPFTFFDNLVQYCTTKTIAVGGGDWSDNPCPFDNEPMGIGFMIDGDLAGGETNSCATFANPRLCKRASASNEFSISNLEVWTLTPCSNVEEAAKLEVHRLFAEANTR